MASGHDQHLDVQILHKIILCLGTDNAFNKQQLGRTRTMGFQVGEDRHGFSIGPVMLYGHHQIRITRWYALREEIPAHVRNARIGTLTGLLNHLW